MFALESRAHRIESVSICLRYTLAAVDKFLTVYEIAETLKVNQQTVRNWIERARSLRCAWAGDGSGYATRTSTSSSGPEQRHP
jgi:hypothetical protein